MARKAKIVNNEMKKKLSAKYAPVRAELKKIINSTNSSDEQVADATIKLQKLPRNSSQVRVRNRCILTGRPRGTYRAFGLSRIKFRELALSGMIPGVTKSSW
ncbi:30S ribosomal protein S14 [Halobacteriovorax sp. JY17]|uniref:30S ribosomal protein S14 n=1 Tax=Halobacteriovorax sp. JY17 TaxID=2014617 RepID=UPI000C57D92D|nr:30S ribosomal protein S14 [Halobacteriovorax sp. JY17]PIK14169.1 MAG: 30S ribosomal protein S14 [Halobacteriovorax sp. JY17]